ncbi:MAG: alpha/beta hydrolase [Burkholderiaceae bacterium]|nr:alpha/beta hydrolase [Burkholderiaceae bacterium]
MKRASIIAIVAAIVAAVASSSHAAEVQHPSEAFKVQVSGEGKPMILIPGLASSGEVWDSTVARYRANYRCHVLTLAGFAGVPATQGDLLQQAEASLSRYISAQHLDRPVIVGHSLGGMLALKLAEDHPEQVGRLVIVDSLPALGATRIPHATPEQLQAVAAQVRDNMEHNDGAQADSARHEIIASMVSAPADIERVEAWGKASDRHVVAESMYDVLASDLRPQLPQIKAPTLVLGTWIAYKQYAPKAAIEATFQQQYAGLSGVKIEMADAARHFIMYDDPSWMFDRMDAFLQ